MSQKKKGAKAKKQLVNEATYSRDEVLQVANGLGVSYELMAGALTLTDKERLTRSDVENVIRKFKMRKV